MNRISAAEDEADKPVSQKLDRSDAVSTFDVGSAFSQDGSLLLSHQSSSFGAAIGMSEGGSLAESSFPTAGEPPASNVEALAVLEEMVRETEALRDILAAGKGGEEDASAVAPATTSAAGSAALERARQKAETPLVADLRAKLAQAQAEATEAKAALEVERAARLAAEAKLQGAGAGGAGGAGGGVDISSECGRMSLGDSGAGAPASPAASSSTAASQGSPLDAAGKMLSGLSRGLSGMLPTAKNDAAP